MPDRFTFLATDLLTGEAREEVPFSTFSYEPTLNRPGAWEGTLPLTTRVLRRLDYMAHVLATRPALYWPMHLGDTVETAIASGYDLITGLQLSTAGGTPTVTAGAGFIADDPESESVDVGGTGYFQSTAIGAELAAELEAGFTVAVWIYGTGVTGSPAPNGDYDVLEVAGARLQLDSATFRLQAFYPDGATGQTVTAGSATSSADHLAAIRYDGTNLEVIVDGAVIGTGATTLPPDLSAAGVVKFLGNLRGRFEHATVWARALSTAELGYLHKLGTGPKTLTTSGKITAGVLEPKTTAVWVARDDVILWGGILWVDGLTDEGEWRVGGMGPMSYLYKRHLRHDKTYTDTDQLDIVRDLLEYAASKTGGDIGLEPTANLSGRLRNRRWYRYERKNIGELITAMAELIDGFDYGTAYAWAAGLPTWTLELGYPRRGTRGGLVLEHGKNVMLARRDRDGFVGGNVVDALGAGEGDRMLIATATDPAVIGTDQPRLETVLQFKSVRELETLEGHARSELAATREPDTTVRVIARDAADFELGAFTIGDEAMLVVDAGPLAIDAWYRIMSYKVAIGPEGLETIEAELADAAAFIL